VIGRKTRRHAGRANPRRHNRASHFRIPHVARRQPRPTDRLRFERGYPSQVPVIFLKVRLKWPGSAAPRSKKLSGNPAALLFSR